MEGNGRGKGGGGGGDGGSDKDRAEIEADANRTMSEIVARRCPPLPPNYFTSRGVPKIVLMGSGGVGKSSLCTWAVQRIFVDKYDPTIEDCSTAHVAVDGQDVRPEILDTAGTEQFTAMRDLYIKSAEGIVLMFSIIARSSFDDLPEIWDTIHSIRNAPIAIVLIGNKDDLEDQRVVTREEAEALAVRWNVPYIETSCKTTHNVEYAFGCMIRFIVELSDPLNKKTKKKTHVPKTKSNGIKRFLRFGK